MENAIFDGELIVALDISKDFDRETEIRVAGRNGCLKCPDPNCQSPLLKYCHGEKKQPYFSHFNNVSCDYADYDKETLPVVREIKTALYQSLKSKGIHVEMDVKLLSRHYTHLLVTMERGERIPIELGTKQASAALTSSLAKQYSEIGVAPIWGLIDNSHELVYETQTFHLKRLLLHASKGNELLVFSLNGKNVTQSIKDENKYFYYNKELISNNYPPIYVEKKTIDNMTIENGKLTIVGFYDRFHMWLENKRIAYKRKVDQLLKAENRKREEWLKIEAEKRLQHQQEEEEKRKKIEAERKWQEQNAQTTAGGNYPMPKEGEFIIHKELRGMKIIKVDVGETTTTVTAVPSRSDVIQKYGAGERVFDWRKSLDDKTIEYKPF